MPRRSSQYVAVCPTGRVGRASLAPVRSMKGVLKASDVGHLRIACMYKAIVQDDDTRTCAANDFLGFKMVFIPDCISSVVLHGTL